MQPSVLDSIVCPITREPLTLEVYEQTTRDYEGESREEIISGMLTAPNGYLYPIVKGVPRLQIESWLDYEDFCRSKVSDFESRKQRLLKDFKRVIDFCIKKNIRTKKSFGFEWAKFDYNADTTWDWDKDSRKQRFLTDVDATADEMKGKNMIDLGCGNGVLTAGISEFGCEAWGLDVSLSIERAFEMNDKPNVHFIQGDLQIPPFRNESFDYVYSTGVIHHTYNTELSFSVIHELTKRDGKLFVWLYHELWDLKHRTLMNLRKITTKLPLGLLQIFIMCTFVPYAIVMSWFGRIKKRTWREHLVNYLDVLSPQFRYEHYIPETEIWYVKRDYKDIKITTDTTYGFGIVGTRI